MPKRQMFVHIGPHKTGTSTIQSGLHENETALSKAGFEYPRMGYVYTGHHNIPAHLAGLESFSPILGNTNDLWKFVSDTDNNIIISSEDFDRIAETEPLQKFKNKFQAEFDIRIIAFLRPQEKLLLSLWQSDYRWGDRHQSYDEWLSTNLAQRFFPNYDKLIGLYADVFGPENVILEIYKPLVENLLFSFLKLCGIASDHFTISEKTANVSYSGPVFELIRLLYLDTQKERPQKGSFEDEQIAAKKIVNFLTEIKFDLQRSHMSSDQLRNIRNTYAAGNKKIAQQFFGRDKLFKQRPAIKTWDGHILDGINRHQMIELTARLLQAEP